MLLTAMVSTSTTLSDVTEDVRKALVYRIDEKALTRVSAMTLGCAIAATLSVHIRCVIGFQYKGEFSAERSLTAAKASAKETLIGR